jgi:lipopolysaccharide/colanic/teichoic acid biosynthesis glycosyltransferase
LSTLRLEARLLKRSTLSIAETEEVEVVLPKPLFAGNMAVALQHSDVQGIDATPRGARRLLFWVLVNLLERIAATLLLLALLPFFLAVAALVLILSRRSPFVAHRRVGRNGCELWVLKFRTMWDDSGSPLRRHIFVERVSTGSELELKHSTDPRITSRFAALCRKYSVDELPQLWHVLRGDMALIGPRPLTAQELVTFYGSDAGVLLLVRPGLSGLWQVNGRSRLTLEERRRLDLFMLENWSLRLYLQILRATVPCVLSGRNAW